MYIVAFYTVFSGGFIVHSDLNRLADSWQVYVVFKPNRVTVVIVDVYMLALWLAV